MKSDLPVKVDLNTCNLLGKVTGSTMISNLHKDVGLLPL